MVNIFREQRHDFINHFQVVLGYLQLNKADRAVTYIKQVNKEMHELSSVTKLDNPYLVVALIGAFQRGKNLGVRLSFQFENGAFSCQDYSEGITDQLVFIIDQSLQFLSAGDKKEQWMEIILREIDHDIIWEISCSLSLKYDELVYQVQNRLDQGLITGGNLKVVKFEDKIRIIFHIPRNN